MGLSHSVPSSSEMEGSPAARVLLISASGHHVMQEALARLHCATDTVATNSDALSSIQANSYAVVITEPATSIEQDFPLVGEIRKMRPDTRVVVLAAMGTSEEILAALRQSVFLCECAPFKVDEIARYVVTALEEIDAPLDFEILSSNPDWITVRMNCHALNAARLIEFFKQFYMNIAARSREELISAFREILSNAFEHGAGNDPSKIVQISAVRTARTVVFHIIDPGKGFRFDEIPHSAISNTPDDPSRHIEIREESGMRPGGYGLLVVKGIVDELIYNEPGNEVLIIKYMPVLPATPA